MATADISTTDCNGDENIIVEKSGVENSGVENSGVEKSVVEMSCNPPKWG